MEYFHGFRELHYVAVSSREIELFVLVAKVFLRVRALVENLELVLGHLAPDELLYLREPFKNGYRDFIIGDALALDVLVNLGLPGLRKAHYILNLVERVVAVVGLCTGLYHN